MTSLLLADPVHFGETAPTLVQPGKVFASLIENTSTEQEQNLREGRHVMPSDEMNPIRDPRILQVLARMDVSDRSQRESAREDPARVELDETDPTLFADRGFSIDPLQGQLIYLLCRAMRAQRVVDFATSVGMSAIYFAAAVRDNGGGLVIGAELLSSKVEVARQNLKAAGLAEWAEIRTGDARQTLRELGGPVDFALIDGFPTSGVPTLAREVIEIVAPQLRVGGYVLNDNAEPDFLRYIRDPKNGFISITLPIKRGTELSLKVA